MDLWAYIRTFEIENRKTMRVGPDCMMYRSRTYVGGRHAHRPDLNNVYENACNPVYNHIGYDCVAFDGAVGRISGRHVVAQASARRRDNDRWRRACHHRLSRTVRS